MSSRSFGSMVGRPVGRDLKRQKSRKPALCQRTTVAGPTKARASFHEDQRDERGRDGPEEAIEGSGPLVGLGRERGDLLTESDVFQNEGLEDGASGGDDGVKELAEHGEVVSAHAKLKKRGEPARLRRFSAGPPGKERAESAIHGPAPHQPWPFRLCSRPLGFR